MEGNEEKVSDFLMDTRNQASSGRKSVKSVEEALGDCVAKKQQRKSRRGTTNELRREGKEESFIRTCASSSSPFFFVFFVRLRFVLTLTCKKYRYSRATLFFIVAIKNKDWEEFQRRNISLSPSFLTEKVAALRLLGAAANKIGSFQKMNFVRV